MLFAGAPRERVIGEGKEEEGAARADGVDRVARGEASRQAEHVATGPPKEAGAVGLLRVGGRGRRAEGERCGEEEGEEQCPWVWREHQKGRMGSAKLGRRMPARKN